MKKKSLALVLALVLLVAFSVGGTLAWLTDRTPEVVNTFTVGNIDITLTETFNADSDGDGTNDYWTAKMVPGCTIDKDPKVTVVGGSEDCWLFVKVEESDNLSGFIAYTIDTTKWTKLEKDKDGNAVTGVYYRDVTSSTDNQVFNVLTGDQVTVKDTVTKAMMDGLGKTGATQPTLTFTAYAVQKAGFDTAAAAWDEAIK